MAEIIDNVKDFIEKYCKILHLANMPVAVRARFDKYAAVKDFTGDMKRWPALLEIADRVNDGDINALPTLPDAKWKDLYNQFQSVFETMANNQNDFKYKDETTKKFFETWYGDDQLFKPQKPIDGLEERIAHFAAFLEKNKFKLSSVISDKNVYGLSSDFKYDSFVSDIKAGKYKEDLELRDQLFAVVKYTQNYSDGANPYYPWGKGVKSYDFSDPVDGKPALPLDTDEWFRTQYDPSFKHRAKEIFNKLLTSSTVRDDFANYDRKGKISKAVAKAIEETDYANKESSNYVPPKYDDNKKFLQKVGDKLDDFKANQIDPWINVLRGTRRYFSPYARTIIEACSKVKNKDGKKLEPTDGLKGILDYADAIKAKMDEKTNKGKSHFDWFVDKLKIYSNTMPKAFDGAFYNPKQMKAIVSQIIMDAIAEGKVAEAKSALEVLSTMKYGILHSQRVDAMKKTKVSIFGETDIAKKYEAVGIAARAADFAIKGIIITAGSIVAAIRNQHMRDQTKFRGNTKTLQKAHEKWQTQNSDRDTQSALDGITRDIEKQNVRKSNIDRLIGRFGGKDSMQATLDDYNQLEQAKVNKEAEIQQAEQQLEMMQYQHQNQGTQLLDNYGNPVNSVTQLEQNILRMKQELQNQESLLAGYDVNELGEYKALLEKSDEADQNIQALTAQQTALQNSISTWDDDHKDKYIELMAFWDMLESFWKSHQITFAANKMRDKFLDESRTDKDGNPKYVNDEGDAVSHATYMSAEFLKKYKEKHAKSA